MPVTLLFVEGELDEQLLTNVFAGAPVVQKRGSKYALKGIVQAERKERVSTAIEFLRDRDFDTEPDLAFPHVPTPLFTRRSGVRLGWNWYRHSIECYLLEPSLAARALNKQQEQIEILLRQAGQELLVYQAARWTVGQARAKLPPMRNLETHPPGLEGDFALPADMSENASWAWLSTSPRDFIHPVNEAFAESALRKSFEVYRAKLTGLDVQGVLAWFSGKNLLAFIAPRLGQNSPGEIRNDVRDWVRNHPEEAVALLPEWATLKRCLAQ
jgi:hypothetical protein